MRESKKLMIQGEEWELKYVDRGEDLILENADGYTDFTTRTLIVEDMQPEPKSFKDLKNYERAVVRHEIIHAFLDESGLRQNSWARNEEMVDFFATQFPKLAKIFKEAEVDY